MNDRKTAHSTYDLKYHIVWITKYRKPILRGRSYRKASERTDPTNLCKYGCVHCERAYIERPCVGTPGSENRACVQRGNSGTRESQLFPWRARYWEAIAKSEATQEMRLAVVAEHSTRETGEVRPKRPSGGKAKPGKNALLEGKMRDNQRSQIVSTKLQQIAEQAVENPERIAHVRFRGVGGG